MGLFHLIRFNMATAIILTAPPPQASYLVGVADPTSTAAVLGLVDQGQVARVGHMISITCQTLTNLSTTQEEVLWLVCYTVHACLQ